MTSAPRPAILALLAAVYLLLAWPGAATRGVIAEEITPYLPRHPLVLARADDTGVTPLPPHDRPDARGWIATAQWPNFAYATETRSWPVLIKGHQSALGTYVGLAAAPLLGDGIAGVRRSSVLLGLGLVLLVFALGRRLGLRPALAGAAALACALSPGLLFFSRTGYGFELASRVAMLVALLLAAAPGRPDLRRSLLTGLALAAAILCRATIAATLVPPLVLLLTHPTRAFAGPRVPFRQRVRGPLLTLAVGAAIPLLFVALVGAAVTFHPGTAPAAKLPLADLADRTAVAPATLAAQLAWVADPNTVLLPLLTGVDARSLLPLAFGTAVLLLALARWWHARAGDAECLLVAAALGNALFGAWLYGNPQQFQLGMALEPLLALAVASQLQSAAPRARRLVLAAAALLLALRLAQCATLLAAERRTENPMLSGQAQRALTRALLAADPGEHSVVTTTYNHVGMLEAWSPPGRALAPVHAYRPLRRAPDDQLVAAWQAILRTYPVRFVVLSTGANPFDGPFTDNPAALRALLLALPRAGLTLARRLDFSCESGTPCLSLLELAPA